MTTGLLALLQLTDSAFPSGAFAHSYGLESLARERLLTNASEVEGFVVSVLRGSIATSDAPVARYAATAAWDGDLDAVVESDRRLYRTKAASELRDASTATGRRLLDETALHVDSLMLRGYAAEVRCGEAPGCHPVAFGVVAAALGIPAADVAPALMQGAVTAMFQASMRLLPVSHRDVQAALHRLRPMIAGIAVRREAGTGHTGPLANGPYEAAADSEVAPHSFAPLQEIASMRHARSSARLFAS